MQEPPGNLTFLYFGLYDITNSAEAKQGFYVSGGNASNPFQAVEAGDLSYFPSNRRLDSAVLDVIREIALRTPELDDVLSYAVTLGAAATLGKEASASVGLSLPIFVGFDSGDYIQIGRVPHF